MVDEGGSTFLQWKGTEVCIDITCPCGAELHFDGWGASFYRCPHCDGLFQLGTEVSITPGPPDHPMAPYAVSPLPDEDLPLHQD